MQKYAERWAIIADIAREVKVLKGRLKNRSMLYDTWKEHLKQYTLIQRLVDACETSEQIIQKLEHEIAEIVANNITLSDNAHYVMLLKDYRAKMLMTNLYQHFPRQGPITIITIGEKTDRNGNTTYKHMVLGTHTFEGHIEIVNFSGEVAFVLGFECAVNALETKYTGETLVCILAKTMYDDKFALKAQIY